jgi:hypothetical protein
MIPNMRNHVREDIQSKGPFSTKGWKIENFTKGGKLLETLAWQPHHRLNFGLTLLKLLLNTSIRP